MDLTRHLCPHICTVLYNTFIDFSVCCVCLPISLFQSRGFSYPSSFSFSEITQTTLQLSLAVSYTHSLFPSLPELSVFTELSVFIIFHFGFGLNSDKMVAANVAPACRISTCVCVCVCVCMYVYACVRVCVGSRKCAGV